MAPQAWLGACKNAGLEGRLFHDFRELAITKQLQSGNLRNIRGSGSDPLIADIYLFRHKLF